MSRILFALLMIYGISVEAQTPGFDLSGVNKYDLSEVRARLLVIKNTAPKQGIQIQGVMPNDPVKHRFIELYRDVIHPKMDRLHRLAKRKSVLNVLIDTNSYYTKEEKRKWKAELSRTNRAIANVMVDKVFAEEIAEWGALAEGLTGELPAYARKLSVEMALDHFPEEMRDILVKVDALHLEYKQALINAPSVKGLSHFNKQYYVIQNEFKNGKITFAEARAQLMDLFQNYGPRYVANDAVKAKGQNLTKLGVLRTKLAQSKGFRTWAEYQLEASGQGYSPEYRGTENQRRFLREAIDQLRPIVQSYRQRRLAEMGLSDQLPELYRHDAVLMTPPDLSQLQPYFPLEKLSDIFGETMLESGFPQSLLDQMIVDILPREGKNPTMAYMAGVNPPQEKTRILDTNTLGFVDSGDWDYGLMYIMQNFRGAGVRDAQTLFHEGMGHAFEYLLKRKQEMTGEGYGYVEVPSMTAEYFLTDPEYLFNKAVPVDGYKPSLEQIREWTKNSEASEGLMLIGRASSALMDLEIWDYDYTQPGAMTYLERLEEVTTDLDKRTGALPAANFGVPSYYAHISGTHYTSGNVRNIGYTYASIGSAMMAAFITEELEKTTGRSTWYKQPGLAKLITEKFYEVGWRKPFPENIEEITGRKFDMKTVFADLTKSLCEDELR